MLYQKSVQFRDRQLTVSAAESQPSQVAMESRTILVRNVPSNLDKTLLELCFESESNGGGDVVDCSLNLRKGKAIITFQKAEGQCVSNYVL